MSRRRKFTIFISYARPNAGAARTLYTQLREARLDPWIDLENLRAGSEWEPVIEEALKEARVVLVLLSKESVTRDGFLQKEIHSALDIWKRKPPGEIYVIPVRLEECEIHSRLSQFHCVDLFHESGWTRLLAQLKKLRRLPRVSITIIPELATSKASIESLRTRTKLHIPLVAFPGEIEQFLAGSEYGPQWSRLDRNVQRHIRTLGCKLEPIVQIIPARAVPVVLGFECLAIGAGGENFGQILNDCKEVDPGVVRICLAIAAIQTVSRLRTAADSPNATAARKLIFSLNLDPTMLDSTLFRRFLHWYGDILERNVIFEVNETTTTKYLGQLKKLQVDFNLRYAADDLNQWNDQVRSALMDRVELTKMDQGSFRAAMDIRGDDSREALKRLRAYKIRGKPLVVEGVQDPDYLMFLERKWDHKKFGDLYGQGYELDPGLHWRSDMLSLKEFGLPGGSALRRRG